MAKNEITHISLNVKTIESYINLMKYIIDHAENIHPISIIVDSFNEVYDYETMDEIIKEEGGIINHCYKMIGIAYYDKYKEFDKNLGEAVQIYKHGGFNFKDFEKLQNI